MPEVVDTCSLASPASVCQTRHLHLRCSVDFTRRVLTGSAALTVQSQEDHLRSLVSVPKELVALMSAIRDGEAPDPEDSSRKIYRFSQKVPIPCYLIALVVGALESRLNEGHTVYLERHICGRLFGEKFRHFHALGGWGELQNSIKTFGETHPFTKLVVDLTNVDPDVAYSSVPYEKGFALLFYLEQLLGGPGK
ncbi:hypothetical protein CB1_000994009 [Camelus ferus]|nr:hypothetical protein CB1_000994009 [Camelus ferus]